MKTKHKHYKKEELELAVKQCTSIRGLLLFYNLKETGGNYSSMSKRLRIMNIDISHFTGKAWSSGKTKESNEAIAKLSRRRTISDIDILTSECKYKISSDRLRNVAKQYIQYICAICNMEPLWRGNPLTLHLDHIDGDNLNNTIDNLRFLCPNCHQQTPTWGNCGKLVPT